MGLDRVFSLLQFGGEPQLAANPDVVIPKRLSRDGGSAWVPPGEQVEIAGRTIDGMVYVGASLGCVARWRHELEPALIVPRAPVGNAKRTGTDQAYSAYWPSYATMRPDSRAAYLDWLAAGRPAGAESRFVNLFIAGLERRIVHDALEDETARTEIPSLLREIERLSDLYADDESFAPRAAELLFAIRLMQGEPIDDSFEPPYIPGSWELPLSLRVALGTFVANGAPIPPKWAFSWYLCHRRTRLRVAAWRCPYEFQELFELGYRHRFGEGMIIPRPKGRIESYIYYPSNPGFGAGVRISLHDLPDIARLQKPLTQFTILGNDAMHELAGYSRAIGAGWPPDSAAALATFPARLGGLDDIPAIVGLRAFLDRSLGDREIGEIDVADLLAHFPEYGSPPSGTQTRAMGNLLHRLGFGVEPNPATARPAFVSSKSIVLFRIDPASTNPAERDLTAPTALVALGRFVASERNSTQPGELDRLVSFSERLFDLTPADVARLRAHIRWTSTHPASLNGLRKPLQQLAPDQTNAAASYLLSIGESAGPIGAADIRMFGRVYTTLGLNPHQVHSDLHTRSTTHSSATGNAADSRKRRRRQQEPALSLDERRIQAVREETAVIAGVLHAVFEHAGPANESVAPAAQSGLGTASDRYEHFLQRIADRRHWPAPALRSLAGSFGLPLAGAIETLNDRAAELGLDPLIECDDEICDVDRSVLASLLANR